jgi:DNA topoisomerase-1
VEGNGEVREETDAKCDLCGSPMAVKNGKFGRFLACTNYPTCKFTKAWETGVRCPQEGCGGMIVERRSRKGRTFYSCSNYPTCSYALWDKPNPKVPPALSFLDRKAGDERRDDQMPAKRVRVPGVC